MEVVLIQHTPLWVCSRSIRRCWASENKSDTGHTIICPKCGHNNYNHEHGDVVSCRECGLHYNTNDICGPKDKELIERVGNKLKHESVKNHVNYTFDITGITTKTLLALTRHDVGTEFSVQSTRYTTKKAVKNGSAGYTESKSQLVNKYLRAIDGMIKHCVAEGESNDEISLLLPQAWRYNLICTMSMSAVQHFLTLRTKSDAHWDIQDLAKAMFNALPEDHKYLFNDYITKD